MRIMPLTRYTSRRASSDRLPPTYIVREVASYSGRLGPRNIVHAHTWSVASFPVPRPAFRCFTILQATKSWAMAWERGYVECTCTRDRQEGDQWRERLIDEKKIHLTGISTLQVAYVRGYQCNIISNLTSHSATSNPYNYSSQLKFQGKFHSQISPCTSSVA